jgi:hypothetical protein
MNPKLNITATFKGMQQKAVERRTNPDTFQ